MQQPTKFEYKQAIAAFSTLATFHKGKEGKSILIYENACKAIQLLQAEMKEKYGKG